jgi:hypothetical protein
MKNLNRRAVREYVGLADHRDRVVTSAPKILEAHVDAFERLGR